MNRIKSIIVHLVRLFRGVLFFAGFFFLVCVVLALTEAPFWGYHWLGTSKSELRWPPQTIVLLGGGGMPSESNLMRCWYAQKAAEAFPDTRLLIAIPGDINDSLSTPRLVKKELLLRGLKPENIAFESKAVNTRGQALNCRQQLQTTAPVLLITSPEHARRSVLCFQKAGFDKVNCLPAFDSALEANLLFNDDELGGNHLPLPDVGSNLNMRYQLWNHLKYEILLAREIVALGYYKLRGWI